MTGGFKDLFSGHADSYRRYRPRYPQALFVYLASLPPGHDCAWDAGTGNGQAACALSPYFNRVIATDPSEAQLREAEQNPKVEYRVGAERAALPEQSVDLITVAQAFHWFHREEFFLEAQRVAREGGVLAIWSYALTNITPEIDAVVRKLHYDVLGSYWEPERKFVEENYATIPIPFAPIPSPTFSMEVEWDLPGLIGYLDTWSALKTYEKKQGQNPLHSMEEEFRLAWGDAGSRTARWTIAPRVFRLSTAISGSQQRSYCSNHARFSHWRESR